MIWSVKVRILEDVEVDLVGVVWLEGDTISVELFRELGGFEFVPLVGGWAILFVLLEALSFELLALFLTLVRENAFVSFYTEALRVRARSLILDEGLERLV